VATGAGDVGGNGIDADWVKIGPPLVATDTNQLNGSFE
jgi:hypothetical protein